MAQQLIQGVYENVVYHLSEEKTEPLKEAGAQTAAAPAEVAKNTDILITMLANPKAVEVSAFGENGFP
jgi:3-hydroxyisobutyrate dehydrogenase/glyoxylate/succinic semialdehyde reductase